jgi:hydrogenase maturation protease
VSRVAVIGIGNPFRRDDGVGHAVAEALRGVDLPGVAVRLASGEPTGVIDAWAGAERAVVVDAARCTPSVPGRVHRIAPGAAAAGRGTSSHGMGLVDAVRLAEALGRAPHEVVVLAVETADVGVGEGLSPAVAAPAAVRAVLAELAVGPAPDAAGR